ncbi:MAG: TolC family protein [Candidatus Tantalella remota]|nr:TolC family protein [Candidatus Tantalella remota]
MKKFILRTVFFSALILFPGHSFAVDVPARDLSLDEFIEMSCSNDRVFEGILTEGLKINYFKKLEMPADDIVMAIKNNYAAYLRPDKGKPEYEFSLAKLFPFTGTEVEAGYSSTAKGSGAADIEGEFYATVTQPVARNAFGRANRLLDEIVGLEQDIAEYQVVEAYEKYLSSVINIYYDWNEAYENLKTAENSYKENMKILDNVREREKNNIALPVDVNKVLLQVLLKEETLIDAGNSFTEYTNLLKKSIGYGIEEELVPVGADMFEGVEIDFDADYAVFREDGRTSLILDMLEEKSLLEVDKYADALFPSIDLFVDYRIKGSDRTLNKDDKRVFAGFALEYPFPGQVENAELATAKIESTMKDLDRVNTQVRIYTELRNIYKEINKEKKLIKIAEKKIKTAQSVVHDDAINYSYGRVVLNNFIDEVNQLDLNRFSFIQRNIRLKKLIIEWLTITDRLVREEGDEIAVSPPSP